MADIGLYWDNDNQCVDWKWSTETNNGITITDIDSDNDLESYIILRLFTNRRAESSWTTTTNKEGWWYDQLDTQGLTGSRLWQLWYLPVTDSDSYESRANDLVREALQTMIDDNIADTIDINCNLQGSKQLNINIMITKTGNSQSFSYIWSTSKQ